MALLAPPSEKRQRAKPRARCSGWNRPEIRYGFLHRVALAFGHAMRTSVAPHWGLRMAIDDKVPSTGRERQRARRWDLTDSIVLVVCCLLARMDMRSLRVGHAPGRRRRHDFIGLSVGKISGWTGLSVPTVSKVLTLLRRAGLVSGPGWDHVNVIHQPYDVRPDGSREWHPAIRRFDVRFFAVLGYGPELHRLRTRKRPLVAADVERVNAGRQIRAAVEGAALDALNRLWPNGPPDG